MANTTFTHIANATEFANIANYIKAHGSKEIGIFTSAIQYYIHNGMEYIEWEDDVETIIIDGTATSLYSDGSLGYWNY